MTAAAPPPNTDVPLVAESSDPAVEAAPKPPLPVRTIALGAAGSVLVLLGAFGAAGVLARDPVLGHGPLSWVRYGHGQMLATMVLYIGFLLMVWAWVRLGRHVLAGRVGSRPVLIAAACWTAPLVIAPPVFTRDVFSYLAQGALDLHGMDPYKVGPIMLGIPELVSNVHPFWQTTPAPYGPLFILLAKTIVSITGTNMILGVILTRLVLMVGLGLLLWALPRLVKQLGGSLPVTLWLAIAGPMTVVHLAGGPHNDLLMVGLMAAGVVCVLERRHVVGIVLVTLAAAVKATALLALPFLVWVWAGHLSSTPLRNFLRAFAAAVGVFLVTFVAVTYLSLGALDLGWINGLQAPAMIVNWLSLPTAVGEIIHTVVSLFVDADKSWFVNIVRGVGAVVFFVIAARQWWASRVGGPEAVRRMAFTLIAVAVLSPTMLPWYLSWGFMIAAALAWQARQLAILVAAGVFLVLTFSPAGEDLLYNWPFIAGAVLVSVLAGISLLRPDPLRLFRDDDELVTV